MRLASAIAVAVCLTGCVPRKQPVPYAVWPGKLTVKPLSSAWVLNDEDGRTYISQDLAKKLPTAP